MAWRMRFHPRPSPRPKRTHRLKFRRTTYAIACITAAAVGGSWMAGCGGRIHHESAWVEEREALDLGAVRLPGEFEPVESMMVAWPIGEPRLEPALGKMVTEASHHVRIVVVVQDVLEEVSAQQWLENAGANLEAITFFRIPFDTIWIRDYGPVATLTRSGAMHVVDLRYYDHRRLDDSVPQSFAGLRGVRYSRFPLRMEGGHLLSDGRGRCLTTDDVLARNKSLGYDRDRVGDFFRRYFGCRNTSFLPALAGEKTGHVDIFAYVTGPARAIVGSYSPYADADNAERLDRAAAILRRDGFRVTRIPMASSDGRKVFRSYTNAVVVNDAVFVPVFAKDRQYESDALSVFQREFPSRVIHPIEADALMARHGALHCTSTTIPFAPRRHKAPLVHDASRDRSHLTRLTGHQEHVPNPPGLQLNPLRFLSQTAPSTVKAGR